MANPTRFPSGLSTEIVGSQLGNFPLPDVTNVALYQNDFMKYVAADWTVVASGSGSSALSAGSQFGGSLLLTWGTSGSQANTLAIAPFIFNPTTSNAYGSQFWFQAECVASATAITPNYLIGAVAGAATAPSDGVYFTKAAGASTWSIVLKSATGSTSTFALPSVNVVANATRFNLAYYYDAKPNPTLWVYYNGNLVGTLGNGAALYNNAGSLGVVGANNLANLPANTVGLAPSVLVGTGGTLEVDHITVACELNRTK